MSPAAYVPAARPRPGQRKLLVVQYAGDYRDTWRRLAAGGPEIYRAQRYSDDAIASLAHGGHAVTVVAGLTEERYREELREGLLAVGLGWKDVADETALIEVASTFRPTHLLLRAPFGGLLAWAKAHQVRVALTLADSFGTGMRAWWRTRRLIRALNQDNVDWVANHGVTSTRSLIHLGAAPRKVIPWDWPHPDGPKAWTPKSLGPRGPRKLVYVGAVTQMKGVGDAIRAVALLVQAGLDLSLDIVGTGEDFQALARELGVLPHVRFVGRLPNGKVIAAMRQADVVLVPSRRDYPEGFPLTLYEALSSRTPIVASDHPMFVEKLRNDESAVLFPSGDVEALADAVRRLLATPSLYAALSEAALPTWEALQVPVKWGDLVRAWAEGTEADRRWLAEHAWSSGRYT